MNASNLDVLEQNCIMYLKHSKYHTSFSTICGSVIVVLLISDISIITTYKKLVGSE